MRIASYNIRKAVGLDWRRDPERIADVLAEIAADIVVLQEADKRVGTRAGVLSLDDLSDRLGYELAEVSERPLSHGWHGNAIFVRKPFEITSSRRVKLPTIEPRGAVSVRIGRPDLEIIGVHLGLTPGMRKKQFSALSQHMDGSKHPIIMAGDFNEWKAGHVIGDIMGAACQVISPGPSFHATRPSAKLDRFVLSGPIRHKSSYVHSSDLAKRASDHLPIVMDVEFAEVPE